jgi:hypothetical protein
MPDAFIDSSVLIGLVFRHAGERAACKAALPAGGKVICSRYVIFEVSRGYLRNLIALHNYCFGSISFSDVHRAAYSGQRKFRKYQMYTWLGAFDDYFKQLDKKDGSTTEALKLVEFRAKLWGWMRRGWVQIENGFDHINDIGCQESLAPPVPREDGRINQELPDAKCGQVGTCGLQAFLQSRKAQVELVVNGLDELPPPCKDKETQDRIDALRYLLAKPPGESFDGKKCWRCGDALICLEAPMNCIIVTKNRKHFEPLAKILGKPLAVVGTAVSIFSGKRTARPRHEP